MWAYIIRRILYAIPILICINILTFLLFFYVNTPDDVAHMVLGRKHVSSTAVYLWKQEHNYHLPRFLNTQDTVLLISRGPEPPADIASALEDYSIDILDISGSALDAGIDALTQDASDEQTITRNDVLRNRITDIRDDINGDHIIIIDAGIIEKEEAELLAGLLEESVPFLVIQRGDMEVPDALRSPVVIVHPVAEADAAEAMAALTEAVDDKQISGIGRVQETLFYKKAVRLFWFNFGKSDREKVDISYEVFTRMLPSLMITVPAFLLGLFTNIFIAMIVAYTRGTYIDRMVAVVCIIIMSILSLFYYFGVQLVFGTWLRIFPVSGFYYGFSGIKFVLLPVAVTVLMGIGGGVRFYRTIFLEEVNREYVRTARSKGMTEFRVLFKHVLKNAMIPILTGAVAAIPMLFVGSLIMESFFGIPGLGGFTLEGLQAQDFRIVGAMVYLGSFLYIIGLTMTDISYTLVDPRVRLD